MEFWYQHNISRVSSRNFGLGWKGVWQCHALCHPLITTDIIFLGVTEALHSFNVAALKTLFSDYLASLRGLA